MSVKNDLISRSALLKRIFPYDVVDKREYSINAKAVEKAIMEAPAIRHRETVVTLHGYNAEALVLIAELLRKNLIAEDELDVLFDNFQRMYEIIIQNQQVEIEGAIAKFTYPGVGEVCEKMQEVADG